MNFEVSIQCAHCWEEQWVEISPELRESFEFVEDCQVCCSPLRISAIWDEESESFFAQAESDG